MFKACGQAVVYLRVSFGLSLALPRRSFFVGISQSLYQQLSKFCTQFLHTIRTTITSVKLTFYPLYTPPTITITTYI
ncbi:MAG: hypothetical protein QG553_869 [Patescibacteria group bacterium]|nr:hypothetical protein [Patescibacteria group bacterium]